MFKPVRMAASGMLALALVGSGTLALAATKSGVARRPLKMRWYGAKITTGQYVFKVVSSLDGTGAAITRVTSSRQTYPDVGTSTTTIYFRDGISVQKVSFVQDVPRAGGISPFRGHGRCAGGTGIHRTEKCSYTFTGTYNVITTQNDVKVSGTETP